MNPFNDDNMDNYQALQGALVAKRHSSPPDVWSAHAYVNKDCKLPPIGTLHPRGCIRRQHGKMNNNCCRPTDRPTRMTAEVDDLVRHTETLNQLEIAQSEQDVSPFCKESDMTYS